MPTVKRFLFVVPPFAGHVLPTVSLARALEDRGHEVAWMGPPECRTMLPDSALLLTSEVTGTAFAREGGVDGVVARGFTSMQSLWSDAIVPLTRGMYHGVQQAAAAFQADVLVVDHQAIAGALAARKLGLPWATLSTTSASVVDSNIDLPKVRAWVERELAALEDFAELPHVDRPDTSRELVIVCSTRELVGPERSFPPHYLFVGPSLSGRVDPTPFPWEKLGPRPRVYASLGTIGRDSPGNTAYLRALVEAARDFPGQLIVVGPPQIFEDLPPNVIVVPRAPQLSVLAEVDAVITHAGHNTTCEALALGLPLIVSPIRHDQPVVAAQVVSAGAGVRVRYARVTPKALREAMDAVLGDPSYREAARRLGASFAAAGGSAAAAHALEALAMGSGPALAREQPATELVRSAP